MLEALTREVVDVNWTSFAGFLRTGIFEILLLGHWLVFVPLFPPFFLTRPFSHRGRFFSFFYSPAKGTSPRRWDSTTKFSDFPSQILALPRKDPARTSESLQRVILSCRFFLFYFAFFSGLFCIASPACTDLLVV